MLHEVLGFSLHVKFVGIMRVCGSATVLFCKLTKVTLSCACRKVIRNRISPRSTANARRECHSRFRRFFHWQHIALVLMQLLVMQHHSSGTIPTVLSYAACFLVVANPLDRCPHSEKKATDYESSNSYSGCGRNNRSRLLYPIIGVPVLPQWTSMFSCRRSP